MSIVVGPVTPLGAPSGPLARYDEAMWEPDGSNRAKLMVGHLVTVYTDEAETTLASLFDDEAGTIPLTNPLPVDAYGNLAFWADLNNAWVKPAGRGPRKVPLKPTVDPGALLKNVASEQTVDGPVVWKVGQAFGQDVRRYGSLGTDASVNTATLNSAFANKNQWSELLIPVPAGQDLPINAELELGECSGKTIATVGHRNFDGSPSAGGRIVQMANSVPILHLKNLLFGRSLKIKLSLAYNTQQSNVNSIGLKVSGAAEGVPHDIDLDVIIDKTYDGIKFVGAGTLYALWNLNVRARIWHTWHTALDNISVGSPSNVYDLFISNTNGGPTPTGPAIKIWNAEALFTRLDIEGWADKFLEIFNSKVFIPSLHVEHHFFNAATNPHMISLVSAALNIGGGSIAMEQTAPGSIAAGYATVVYLESAKAKLHADDIDLIFPTALAGNVCFLDGASGIDESFVGHGVRSLGTKAIDLIAKPSYEFYDASLKYRYPFPTAWVEPELAAGWVPIDGYQRPRYRKLGDVVEGEGACKNTSGGALATPAYVLPAGHRPLLAQINLGYGDNAATPLVLNGGAVQPPSAVANEGIFPTQFRFSVK